MSKLTHEEIVKLAHLARISLTDAEIELFRSELSEIIQYVEQLQAVEITGLEPTHQVTGLTNVMRDDVERSYGYSADLLLANVPAVQDNQIKVKRMVG